MFAAAMLIFAALDKLCAQDAQNAQGTQNTPNPNGSVSAGAASAATPAEGAPTEGASATGGEEGKTAELSSSFRQLSLGMDIDALKKSLLEDNLFNFRGDIDVSYLPLSEQNLVESAGNSYIKRAFFQLKDKALFIMSFTMNTDIIDHYSVFTAFVKKYGQPSVLNPKEAVWESDNVRISIERPLTVKYIDKKVFDALLNESSETRSRLAEMRDAFLDNF